MSELEERGGATTLCGAVPGVLRLQLLAEYMDANKCIDELLKQLEEERRSVRREKLAVARLQREVARSKSEGTMREKLIHELEEERRLRLESEKRLREVTEESELGRAQMVSLQQQFSRMEETVRLLLQNQGVLEQTAVDPVDIMKAYKDKLSEEVQKQDGAPPEPPDTELDAGLADEDRTKVLVERLKALEDKNSDLALENENQREQYERCLDEVANQVVQALLTQKDLREECVKLRTRVFDLEQQNRALGILFQQRIKPASDLLLQKLHSRILDLSGADLLLEPERSKAFLLSRSAEAPCSQEAPLKLSFPLVKCLSQLNLVASPQPPPYPRSSCSSSELSLSSACSDFSSGSYTWNDGRSCGKSSLTWEKRLSLGSSAPGNICGAAPEEPPPTRRKESHILEGLRKLQRRKHRSSSSSSSKVSKSECMDSNEGIYSLGIKSGAKGVSKPGGQVSRARGRHFSYDSDDADDELVRSGRRDNVPTKDGWSHGQRRSHSISDSRCSWDGTPDGGADAGTTLATSRPPPGYDSKERPEKLLSFINSFLPEGGRPSAFSRPSKLNRNQPDPPDPPQPATTLEGLRLEAQAERDSRRPSRDAAKLLAQQCLRTQSADGRPRPFSLIREPTAAHATQSQESVVTIYDAEGEPIQLCPQGGTKAGAGAAADYTELVPHDRPTRQKPTNTRTYSVLENPEKPSEYLLRTSSSSERQSVPPQRKLIKPASTRANKGLSIPPMNQAAGPKSTGSKIPGRNRPTPTGSPMKLSKGCSTEPANSGPSGPSGLEKSPSSAFRMSRFMKSTGTSSQSPKAVNTRLAGRAEWGKTSSSSSCSPHLTRRHLEYPDPPEQPTRDQHCETSKNKLRSPSPPPPPGRTTSLLIKPNYEGSPQAHRPGPAPPSTPPTARGPPPSYHTSLLPNMQSTLPIKDKEAVDQDAGYGTALAPHRLVDKSSQHLQKSPAATQTPTKGTSRRTTTKDYLPPASSGCAREPEAAPKGSKNVPPPYSALRGSSLQAAIATKRGSTHEHVHQPVHKSSISVPVSLQVTSEPHSCKVAVSPPGANITSPNPPDKSPKTRIPMGFKAFLKSPSSQKNSPSVPGKQEKDHINSVSKETVTSSVSTPRHGSPPPAYDSPAKTCGEVSAEVRRGSQEEEVLVAVVPEEGKRGSQLFGRSISVTTKPHLKPALGMNGAKARSQSFSANYTDKASLNSPDGPGKIRTQIITNSGDRGNSLSRQSSLEVPTESPLQSPRTRLSHYGGMTAAHCQGVLQDRTKTEAPVTSPSHKEAPTGDRTALKAAKGGSQSQHSQENPARESEGLNQDSKTPTGSPTKTPDTEEEKSSPTCTIEEKVMMGIEENLHKFQEQEKVSEVKQKTGPSLANWFGLRRSKLPALSGKKAETPRGKEEKKELKIGSVLGGKQRRDKKKESQQKEAQDHLSEVNNKLSSIMDHCNNQMGHIASHIHSTSTFMGKEQLVRELLGRTSVKLNSPTETCGGRKQDQSRTEGDNCGDTATLLMSQKMNLRVEHEGVLVADSACQDHVIGSASQMRTLDSGIGTFPLPDALGRAGGRHLPRSESGPEEVTAGSSQCPPHPTPPQPDFQVPSPSKPRPHATTSLAHSLSDPSVTCSGSQDAQSHLPKLASSDAIRMKRLSAGAPRSVSSSISSSGSPEHTDVSAETKMKDQQGAPPQERALRVCTYPGSSSDTETELEGTGSTLCSPRRPLSHRATTSESGERDDDTLKRSGEASLSIMDLYQRDVFSQYDLLHADEELPVEKREVSASRPPSLHFSLDSLNKLNHGTSSCCPLNEPPSSSSGSSLSPTLARRPPAMAASDPAGSLSDSLYDSFSSCTSRGSNGV